MTLSNRGGYGALSTFKTEFLATLVISKTLLTKFKKSFITDVAGLLDTSLKTKLPKSINRNITKEEKSTIRESLILISFSVK